MKKQSPWQFLLFLLMTIMSSLCIAKYQILDNYLMNNVFKTQAPEAGIAAYMALEVYGLLITLTICLICQFVIRTPKKQIRLGQILDPKFGGFKFATNKKQSIILGCSLGAGIFTSIGTIMILRANTLSEILPIAIISAGATPLSAIIDAALRRSSWQKVILPTLIYVVISVVILNVTEVRITSNTILASMLVLGKVSCTLFAEYMEKEGERHGDGLQILLWRQVGVTVLSLLLVSVYSQALGNNVIFQLAINGLAVGFLPITYVMGLNILAVTWKIAAKNLFNVSDVLFLSTVGQIFFTLILR